MSSLNQRERGSAPNEWRRPRSMAGHFIGRSQESNLEQTSEFISDIEGVFVECADPNQRLEANRYYGLGKIICGLAIRLQNPDVREQILTDSAEALSQLSYIRNEPGIKPYDILSNHYKPPIVEKCFVEALEDLGCDEQLLINILCRLSGSEHAKPTLSTGKSGSPAKRQRDIARQLHMLAEQNPAVNSLQVNMFAGASGIIYGTLNSIYKKSNGNDLTNERSSQPYISDLAPDGITGLSIPNRLALSLARIRIDDFNARTRSDKLIEGKPQEGLRASDEEPDADLVFLLERPLHRQSIGCPAISAGMIRPVMKLTADIVDKANQMALRNHAETTQVAELLA